MPSRQSQLQEDTIFRVLRLLQDKPDVTQRELAAHLGMSLGGLNYCLRALVDKGLVATATLHNDKSQRKNGYLLTPAGLAHRILLTGRFLARKQRELEALQIEIQDLTNEVQPPNRHPIKERSSQFEDGKQRGHWGGDTAIGAAQNQPAPLVARQSNLTLLAGVPNQTADWVGRAIEPKPKEFANPPAMDRALVGKTYFADAYCRCPMIGSMAWHLLSSLSSSSVSRLSVPRCLISMYGLS